MNTESLPSLTNQPYTFIKQEEEEEQLDTDLEFEPFKSIKYNPGTSNGQIIFEHESFSESKIFTVTQSFFKKVDFKTPTKSSLLDIKIMRPEFTNITINSGEVIFEHPDFPQVYKLRVSEFFMSTFNQKNQVIKLETATNSFPFNPSSQIQLKQESGPLKQEHGPYVMAHQMLISSTQIKQENTKDTNEQLLDQWLNMI